jgi:small conductance mechanosensitive channel
VRPPEASYQSASARTGCPGRTSQEDWLRLVGVLVVFYVALKLGGWLGRKARDIMLRRKIDAALAGFVGNLTRWGVIVLAALACLGAFGIETASFAAVLAGAGLAIGLAFQGTLSNFAAGVMLLIFRPFTVGDVISVAGVTGKVKELGIFTTDFDTPDNRRIILPNGALFGATIENVTFHETRRCDVSVGAAYAADTDRTREVLLEAVQGLPGVMEEPAPQVYLDGLGSSSVNYQVRVWCKTAEYWDVREAMTRAIKLALDAAQIGIPFPQMDVHLFNPPA